MSVVGQRRLGDHLAQRGAEHPQRRGGSGLLDVKNVNLRFVTKDSLFESRREYVKTQ